MASRGSGSTASVAGLLAGVPAFSDLSEPELERIAQVAVPRSFPMGSVLIREGDPGDTCYVLRSGRARVTREHAGHGITLTNIGPGEIFGELAMFDGEVRSATVEALEDVEVVAILADDLRRVLREHPETAVKLLRALAQKLRDANERLARQSFQKVSSRVAGVLLRLIQTASGTTVIEEPGGDGTEIVVQATQAELAQLAGASREATSRFLATLQRAGVVDNKRGRVIVHDPAALRRYIY
jgi:CRP/FNR family transcriptional regulator